MLEQTFTSNSEEIYTQGPCESDPPVSFMLLGFEEEHMTTDNKTEYTVTNINWNLLLSL